MDKLGRQLETFSKALDLSMAVLWLSWFGYYSTDEHDSPAKWVFVAIGLYFAYNFVSRIENRKSSES